MVYNLKRQKQDERDYKLQLVKVEDLPNKIDLRKDCPQVFNQGDVGSCTAQAGVAARMMLDDINTVLSRLYLYYKEREMNGDIKEDSGATMRDVCKALNKYGVCEETIWPYDVKKYADTPPIEASLKAEQYKIKSYKSLRGTPAIKEYLAVYKKPVLIGMDVYDSFESYSVAKNGKVPMPNKFESYLGGHAILIVGYDDALKVAKKRGFFAWLFGRKEKMVDSGCFICRNSWGADWGDDGYFYLPYDYVNQGLAYDAWVIE